MGHPLGRLGLLHPFPSALNALLVAVLATLAGAPGITAATLAVAMLGFQVSIGALNDLVDAPADRQAKPGKPIPAGLASIRAATIVVVAGAVTGLTLSLAVSPMALLLGAVGYGCGVAYDLELKRRGLGWVAFTVAFPVLLLYAWTGGGGGLPPGWALLLPIAALAGPALHLANALTDLEADRATGVDGPAVRLGRGRAVVVLGALLLAVYGLAWLVILAADASVVAVTIAGIASLIAALGFAGSASGTARGTAWGWTLQAIAIAALALAWVVAATT